MDRVALVHRRKKRYMAIILTQFEEICGPYLPPEKADEFKGVVRQKMHALTLDANEIHSLKPGEELNGAAVELRDQIDPSASLPRRVPA